jgi:putative membrane protein
MMFGYQPGWGWMMVALLLWLALPLALGWAAVRLLQRPGNTPTAGQPRETPQEILDRRFASGEIDAQTYARMRDQLTTT